MAPKMDEWPKDTSNLKRPALQKDLDDAQQRHLRYMMGVRLGKSVAEAASTRKPDDKSSSFNFPVDSATIKTLVDTMKALKAIA